MSNSLHLTYRPKTLSGLFLKFWPYIWLVFKSGLWLRARGISYLCIFCIRKMRNWCGIWLDKILNKCITVHCNVQEGAGFSVKQKQPRGQKLQIGKFIRTCAILFPNCHPAQALKTKVPITVVTAKMLLTCTENWYKLSKNEFVFKLKETEWEFSFFARN